jgi:Domain of unknown function (DUF4123)
MNRTTMHVETDFLVGLLRPYQAAIIDQFRLGERWNNTVPIRSLVPATYQTEVNFFPVLVDFKALTANQSHQLLETLLQEHQNGADLSAQVLFTSQADGDTLHNHWLNHLVVSMAGQTRVLLRSYDPRVFLQLHRILNATQLKSLFGPISSWTIYWKGAWLRFDVPEAPSGYLQPNAAQVTQIQRIEAINEVLALLAEPAPVLPSRAKLAPKAVPDYATQTAAYDAMSERIDSLLQQAAQRGWPRQSDAVLFALLGLLLSPGWHQYPKTAALLDNANNDEQTLQDVLALMTLEEWAQLSADLASIP